MLITISFEMFNTIKINVKNVYLTTLTTRWSHIYIMYNYIFIIIDIYYLRVLFNNLILLQYNVNVYNFCFN